MSTPSRPELPNTAEPYRPAALDPRAGGEHTAVSPVGPLHREARPWGGGLSGGPALQPCERGQQQRDRRREGDRHEDHGVSLMPGSDTKLRTLPRHRLEGPCGSHHQRGRRAPPRGWPVVGGGEHGRGAAGHAAGRAGSEPVAGGRHRRLRRLGLLVLLAVSCGGPALAVDGVLGVPVTVRSRELARFMSLVLGEVRDQMVEGVDQSRVRMRLAIHGHVGNGVFEPVDRPGRRNGRRGGAREGTRRR